VVDLSIVLYLTSVSSVEGAAFDSDCLGLRIWCIMFGDVISILCQAHCSFLHSSRSESNCVACNYLLDLIFHSTSVMQYIAIQWNLSIKDTLNKRHLSNEDTVCSPNHIRRAMYKSTSEFRDTSLYRTASCVPAVSSMRGSSVCGTDKLTRLSYTPFSCCFPLH